jgi:hypothetical protein
MQKGRESLDSRPFVIAEPSWIPTDGGNNEGRQHMPQNIETDETNPRPTDPPFLFCILLAARKSRDAMLESLARDWLAEVGIRVVFSDEFDAGKGVRS